VTEAGGKTDVDGGWGEGTPSLDRLPALGWTDAYVINAAGSRCPKSISGPHEVRNASRSPGSFSDVLIILYKHREGRLPMPGALASREPSSALITRVFACAPCADGLEQLGEKADENWDTGIRGDDVPRVWILVCPIKQAFETADLSIHG